jgi:hypothetical protein
MSFGPHPNILTMIAEERRMAMRPQADNRRPRKLAQSNTHRRQPWSDVPVPRAVTTVLALLAAFERGS